jgi:hypothetical protein
MTRPGRASTHEHVTYLDCLVFCSQVNEPPTPYSSHGYPPTIFTYLHCILFWLNLYLLKIHLYFIIKFLFFGKTSLIIGKIFTFR